MIGKYRVRQRQFVQSVLLDDERTSTAISGILCFHEGILFEQEFYSETDRS